MTIERRPLGYTLENGDSRPSRDRRLKYFINEVLTVPPAARPYYLNQALHELCSDKYVLEVADHDFRPLQYAEAGNCRLVDRPVPHSRRVTTWIETESLCRTSARQTWFEVEWRENQLDMLLVHDCDDDRSGVWRYYVLTDSRELAEAFFAEVCRWKPDVQDAILVFDGDDWEKDKKMAAAIRSATFKNLILKDTMKEDILHDVAWFFAAKPTYDRYGAPWKRGILFVGPPGNGKTHTVKAVLNASAQTCLYVQSFKGSYGRSEDAIRSVFDEARKHAPCILVLEDIDTLVTTKNRSYFLNQLDGFLENDGMLTLGTSNHPERLDPAIALRPSRFDRTYRFELPGQPERLAYLQRWNATVDPELRLADEALVDLAGRTEGFSFAYLKELVLSSAIWRVSAGGQIPADEIMRETAATLKAQMAEVPKKKDSDKDKG